MYYSVTVNEIARFFELESEGAVIHTEEKDYLVDEWWNFLDPSVDTAEQVEVLNKTVYCMNVEPGGRLWVSTT